MEERKNAGDDEIERLRLDNQKQLDEKYALLEELRNAQTSLKTDQQANATTVQNLKNEISNLQNELTQGKKRETELNAKLKSLQDKRARMHLQEFCLALPIFSERTALLLKKQIQTLDRCHIIAISPAVANVFLDVRAGSVSEAQKPDLLGMKSLTKKVLQKVLLE